jgi:hypothetical protein
MLSIKTIFSITNWSLTLISIFLFLLIIIIYIKTIKEDREKDVSLLLTMNTCLAAFLTSLCVITMVSSNLFHGFLLIDINFCYIFGLCYDIFECSIYYSYSLQSFYRLIRVIYYRKRTFLSYNLYRILIIIEWFIAIGLLIPTIFLKWYIILPGENYCLVPYRNITGSIYLIIVLYSIPLFSIILVYILITKYIHSTTMIRIRERTRNLRDLTVMKRIIACVLMLILLRFPTIIFILFGVFNGYLYFLTYPIVGLVTAICLILISLIILTITNKFKKQLFKFFNKTNNQINPATNQSNNQINLANNQITTPSNTLATLQY